ncbi:MAG: CvpA family protein [Gammaproteobacteria bacterium]|nr:CvpA family protein [Gammaproteobacteria bacterium]
MPTIWNFAAADVVMGIVIVVSALFGLMRGLVREVLSLVIWVAALLLGTAFADFVAAMLGLDLSPTFQTAIGFAIVFIAVLVAGALAQRFLGGLVESTGLTGTDRTLGLVFGTLRGAAVVLVALILLRPFAESRDWWAESRIAPTLLTFENEMIELFDLMTDAVSDPLAVAPRPTSDGDNTASKLDSGGGLLPRTSKEAPPEGLGTGLETSTPGHLGRIADTRRVGYREERTCAV